MSDVIISIPGATDVTIENAAASSVVVTFPASNNFVTTVIDRGVLYGIVGAQGTTGPQGATGPQGNVGPGVAAGGSTGQVLKKASATDYDTYWGAGADWGNIGGTLSNQTDLQTALNGKQNSLGFTPEDVANKSTTLDADKLNNSKYPSVKSVYDWATLTFQTALGFTPVTNARTITINGVTYDLSSNRTWNTIKTKRHDFDSSTATDYCGTAPYGSSDSSAVWTIKKLVIASSGSTTITTATNVAWTNRYTAIYI